MYCLFGAFLTGFFLEGEYGWDDGQGSGNDWKLFPIRGVGPQYDNWVEGFAGVEEGRGGLAASVLLQAFVFFAQ